MKPEDNWVRTHCARMDHGGCALLVKVENNRITQIKGDPDGFLNQGYICPKGLASAERLYHPQRLRYPLKRQGRRGGGKWKRITWAEAIACIADNLVAIRERDGARAVAFCQGMPKGLDHFVLIRLANAFGSPNVVAVQDVCHAPREVSSVHTCGFYPVADWHHPSRLIVLWGSNMTNTNEEGAICSLLAHQRKQGAQVLVVDPRETQSVKDAQLWLQLRPGSDHALAMAFINVIIQEGLYDRDFVQQWTYGFDKLTAHVAPYTPEKMALLTGVSPEKIRQGARLYARCRPAILQWGNPIEQNRHAFDTVRTLVCLMAICGNMDIPGGNIQAVDPPVLPLGNFVRADLLPQKRHEMLHAHHNTIPKMMTVPPSYFKQAVLHEIPYPVRGAYMQCTNPMLGYADSRQTRQALMKLDFLAVSDICMTPTVALADIVLPAATHFEFNDMGHYGLGHGYILARPKMVDPPAECWSDLKILNALGQAMTPKDLWYEDAETLLEDVLSPSGLSYAEFCQQGVLRGKTRYQKYCAKGFKTPTGKVELVLSRAAKLGLPPLPRAVTPPETTAAYPLLLTSAKSRYFLHSSYRWIDKLRQRNPRATVQIHPTTATQYQIAEGDQVVIETPQGKISQWAQLTTRISPDVVYAAYGWWRPEASVQTLFDWDTANYNMLTSSQNLGREFGTPNLKGIPCRIYRATAG